MLQKIKITGIAILAISLLAGTAMAQGWDRPGGGPRMGAAEMSPGPGAPGGQGGFGMENLARFRMMFRYLDLTDDQAENIRSISEIAREEARAIMEAARGTENHASFIEIFTSPTLTVSDLENATSEMEEVQEDMQEVIFQAMVDIHDVLTAEQLEKLADLAEEHAGEMGHGPEMRSGPGMRPGR